MKHDMTSHKTNVINDIVGLMRCLRSDPASFAERVRYEDGVKLDIVTDVSDIAQIRILTRQSLEQKNDNQQACTDALASAVNDRCHEISRPRLAVMPTLFMFAAACVGSERHKQAVESVCETTAEVLSKPPAFGPDERHAFMPLIRDVIDELWSATTSRRRMASAAAMLIPYVRPRMRAEMTGYMPNERADTVCLQVHRAVVDVNPLAWEHNTQASASDGIWTLADDQDVAWCLWMIHGNSNRTPWNTNDTCAMTDTRIAAIAARCASAIRVCNDYVTPTGSLGSEALGGCMRRIAEASAETAGGYDVRIAMSVICEVSHG